MIQSSPAKVVSENLISPYQDTFTGNCKTCSLLQLQGKKEEVELHQEKMGQLNAQMKKVLEKSNCVKFDLQQVQPIPLQGENKSFYHRKTCLYYLCIHMALANRYIYVYRQRVLYQGDQFTLLFFTVPIG